MKNVSELKPKVKGNSVESVENNELDSIKSILFGTYAQEMDKRLQSLEEKIDKRFEEQRLALNELSQSAKALSTDKVGRENLASLLADAADRLSKSS